MTTEPPYNHVGILVTDIAVAVATFAGALGLEFHEPVVVSVEFMESGHRHREDLRFTYSKKGPPYVELLQCTGAALFGGGQREGLHHIGGWSPNLVERAEQLAQFGVGVQAEVLDSSGEAQTIFTSPADLCGIRLEFLHEHLRPGMEHWLETGQMTDSG